VDKPSLDRIAEAANGDVRHALTTLQMHCVGARPAPPPGLSKALKKALKPKEGGFRGMANRVVGARDERLGTFHVVGKLLYNKRLPPPPEGEGAPGASGM
jgi:hypothetical protein